MWVLWIVILTVGSGAGGDYPALTTSKLWFGDRPSCEVAQQAIIRNAKQSFEQSATKSYVTSLCIETKLENTPDGRRL